MRVTTFVFTAFACALCFVALPAGQQPPSAPVERHLATSGSSHRVGENAEAYFSPDGKRLIYQTNPGAPGTCDQIFTMNVDGSNKSRSARADGQRADTSSRTGSQSSTPRRISVGGMSSAPEFRARLRLAYLRLYDIFRSAPDGSGTGRAHRVARLRRRSDDRSRRPHRVHQRSRRRHGDLLDERRRLGRPPSHESCGS